MDLVEFLRARLAEDRAWARQQERAAVRGHHLGRTRPQPPGHWSRVLVECEAKLSIVEEYELLAASPPASARRCAGCSSTSRRRTPATLSTATNGDPDPHELQAGDAPRVGSRIVLPTGPQRARARSFSWSMGTCRASSTPTRQTSGWASRCSTAATEGVLPRHPAWRVFHPTVEVKGRIAALYAAL